METLLFHPKTMHEGNYRNFWIPYSVLSVGSQLSPRNIKVRIFDNNLENMLSEQFEDYLKSVGKPSIVGISSMIGHQIQEGFEFASATRSVYPDIPIIWGGVAPTILYREFSESPLVDIVVRGQGESVIYEIVEGKKDAIQSSPLRQRSQFSPYDFDLMDVEKYIKPDENINTRTINHFSSQGCPFGCGFCSEVALYKQRWFSQDAKGIIHDVKQLIERFGVNGIKFYDANFFVNKRRVLEFANKIEENGWDIAWAGAAHPNNLYVLSDQEFYRIRKSGCSRILIGAESGNQDELDYVGKRTTTDKILEVAKKLGDNGIHGSFTVIVGYPGFPEENIDKTIEFGDQIMNISSLHEVKAHVYAPFPGTSLYSDAIKYGFKAPKTLENWANYDYYEVQTPWLKTDLNDKIKDFNRRNCPYVL